MLRRTHPSLFSPSFFLSLSDSDTVWPAIGRLAVATISASAHKLSRTGRGFEWLGVDVMLDSACTPWLEAPQPIRAGERGSESSQADSASTMTSKQRSKGRG